MKISEIILTCRKEGAFKLHSGEMTDHIYDIMELINNAEFLFELMKLVNHWSWNRNYIVGIEFGGSILATYTGINKEFGIVRKDGTVYGNIPDDYMLIDDVVTTENSIRKAIKDIGKEPSKILCVVDRRKTKSLDIKSIYSEENNDKTKDE